MNELCSLVPTTPARQFRYSEEGTRLPYGDGRKNGQKFPNYFASSPLSVSDCSVSFQQNMINNPSTPELPKHVSLNRIKTSKVFTHMVCKPYETTAEGKGIWLLLGSILCTLLVAAPEPQGTGCRKGFQGCRKWFREHSRIFWMCVERRVQAVLQAEGSVHSHTRAFPASERMVPGPQGQWWSELTTEQMMLFF